MRLWSLRAGELWREFYIINPGWPSPVNNRPLPGWPRETTGKIKHLETQMPILRKTSAIALMIAVGGTMAHAETKLAAKDIVIVHGALVDGSGWRAVHDIRPRMASM